MDKEGTHGIRDAIAVAAGRAELEPGIPHLPPASAYIERFLQSGLWPSRGIGLLCEELERANLLALALARAWLCGGFPLGCGRCNICTWVSTHDHSELSWLDPVTYSGEVGADMLNSELTRLNPEKSAACIIVDDCQRLSASGASYLAEAVASGRLMPGGMLILTARSVTDIPEPLRSRCVRFEIGAEARDPEAVTTPPWTEHVEAAYERRVLGLDLPGCGDVFAPPRELAGKQAIRTADEIHKLWDQRPEETPGEPVVVWTAGVAVPSDSALDRANGILSLETRDGGLLIEPSEALDSSQRSALLSGECLVLRVELREGLRRWHGSDVVGRVLESQKTENRSAHGGEERHEAQ